MADLIRVNTRISKEMNEWLDKQVKLTGVPKSTQIMLALESYRKEKEVLKGMADMKMVMDKLEELGQKIKK